MSKKYSKGTHVSWLWGEGVAEGIVDQAYEEHITRVSKGSKISCNGSHENPAYVIKQKNGTLVLKLHSELSEK